MEVSVVNIIIAEGEESSGKLKLVSVLKAGPRQKKPQKIKTGLRYLRKWSLSFDLHPLQGPNYNSSIQAQTVNIPPSASKLGNHVKWVKDEWSDSLEEKKQTTRKLPRILESHSV